MTMAKIDRQAMNLLKTPTASKEQMAAAASAEADTKKKSARRQGVKGNALRQLLDLLNR